MNSDITNDLIRVNPLTKLIYRRISIAKYNELRSIRKSNHIDLFEIIRLETRTRCNGRCNFCPCAIQYETRPDVKMTGECFRKIIDELAYIKYDGHIQMYINNEPLIDKRIVEFLSYIKLKNLNLRGICIATNGLALTLKLGTELFENGLTWLIVNDYSMDGSPSKKLEDVVGMLRKRFPDRRIELAQRSVREVLSNRAGGHSPNNPTKVSLNSACTYPLRQMNITANGNVGLCCQDIYVNTPLGNVMQNSLTEIWNGNNYANFRKNLSRGDRQQYELCKYCDFRGYTVGPQKRKWACFALGRLADFLLEKQKQIVKSDA